MSLLEALNTCNDVKILSVEDKEFAGFGKILSGYDVMPLLSYMESETTIPEE